MLLEKQIAVVTGAGTGNGRAIALGLAAAGALVIPVDIDADSAHTTANLIVEGGGAAFKVRAVDIADREACNALAAEVGCGHGLIDVLVNNAGICPRGGIDEEGAATAWTRTIAVNLDGAANMIRAFLPALRQSKGRIVNVTSIAAFASTRTAAVYAASKGALTSLTKALAVELAPAGIRVNAVAPGPFATSLTVGTRSDPARYARFVERIPLGRFGEPAEMAGPVVFLASEMSSFMTGAVVVVDGGYLAN
jgi:NAD(P)-dependent dehydrogenase (short-subunit alcohol dehydrogenase family)